MNLQDVLKSVQKEREKRGKTLKYEKTESMIIRNGKAQDAIYKLDLSIASIGISTEAFQRLNKVHMNRNIR